MKAGKLFLFLVAGGLFGSGLAISGMTDPARVIGFLDVFGAWDPALLFVMAGAVGVYGLGMLVLRRVRESKPETALGGIVADRSPACHRGRDFRRGLGAGRVLSRAGARQSRRSPS